MASGEARDPVKQVESLSRDLRDVEVRSAYAAAARDKGRLARLNTLRQGLMRDLLYWKGRIGPKGRMGDEEGDLRGITPSALDVQGHGQGEGASHGRA